MKAGISAGTAHSNGRTQLSRENPSAVPEGGRVTWVSHINRDGSETIARIEVTAAGSVRSGGRVASPITRRKVVEAAVDLHHQRTGLSLRILGGVVGHGWQFNERSVIVDESDHARAAVLVNISSITGVGIPAPYDGGDG